MCILNVPYSADFCAVVADVILQQCIREPLHRRCHVSSTLDVQHRIKCNDSCALPIAIMVPTKILKVELQKNIARVLRTIRQERAIEVTALRIFSYSELDQYLWIFSQQRADSQRYVSLPVGVEDITNHILCNVGQEAQSQNGSSTVVGNNVVIDETQMLVLLEHILEDMLGSQAVSQQAVSRAYVHQSSPCLGTLANGGSAVASTNVSSLAYHKRVIHNLLNAVSECYSYNIQLDFFRDSFDPHEKFLYDVIIRLDKILLQHNLTFKAKYSRSVSDYVCAELDALDSPLKWRIFCIPPQISLPYIDNIIISLCRYYRKLDSQNVHRHGTVPKHWIFTYGMDPRCIRHDIGHIATIKPYHQQYVHRTLLENLNLQAVEIEDIGQRNHVDRHIHEIFSPNVSAYNGRREEQHESTTYQSLNYSVVAHHNRSDELLFVAQYLQDYLVTNARCSVCIVGPEALDCDVLWHYIKRHLTEYDTEHHTNFADDMGSYVPHTFADKYAASLLFAAIIDNYSNANNTQDIEHGVLPGTEKYALYVQSFFRLMHNPDTFFYNEYGEELQNLESFYHEHYLALSGKPLERIIAIAVNNVCTKQGLTATEHVVSESCVSRTRDFLRHCAELHRRLLELYDCISNDGNMCNILDVHISVLEYLLYDKDEDDADFMSKIMDAARFSGVYDNVLCTNSTTAQINCGQGDVNMLGNTCTGIHIYSKFLYNILHKRRFYRNDTFFKRIKICTPADVLFCKYDLLIATHMEEGKFPQLHSNNVYISSTTRRCVQQSHYASPAELDIGYGATCFAHFLSSAPIVLFTYSGTDALHTVRNRWIELLLAYARLRDIRHKLCDDIGEVASADQAMRCVQLVAGVADYPASCGECHSVPMYTVANAHEVHSVCETHWPNPQLEMRPKFLSTTAIEELITNPYAFYVRRILNIGTYDTADIDQTSRCHFGILLHKIIHIATTYGIFRTQCMEEFAYLVDKVKEDAMKALGWDVNSIPQYTFWEKRINRIMLWMREHKYAVTSDTISQSEYKVTHCIKLTGHGADINIKCSAVLDYAVLDLSCNILKLVDYKTGKIPTEREICTGYKPQLPLQVLLLKHNSRDARMFQGSGSYIDRAQCSVQQDQRYDVGVAGGCCHFVTASYLQLTGKKYQIAKEKFYVFDVQNIEDELTKVLRTFYVDLVPYAPGNTFYSSSYAHLSRVDIPATINIGLACIAKGKVM